MSFQKVNEHSLQQLSAVLEAQQSSQRITVPPLPFYLRQQNKPDGKYLVYNIQINVDLITRFMKNNLMFNFLLGQFKLIKIQLNSNNNVRDTVVKVLNACDIPTKYVDKIPHTAKKDDFR